MKNSKIVTMFITIMVLVTLLLSACQTPPAVTYAPEDAEKGADLRALQKDKPFIYVGNNLAHPTIKLMMLGFWDACNDYGVKCKFIVDSGTDEASLIAATEKAIAFGASGMVDSSYAQFRSEMLLVRAAGIPLVGTHGNVAGIDGAGPEVTGLIAWVAPDPIVYGTQVADVIAERTSCGSPVIVTQSSFNSTEDAANKGFHDEYLAKCPNAEILPTEQEGLEPVAAIAKVSAIILAHPDLVAAFGTTGGSINAWGKAMQQAGYEPGKIMMIGMDATKENIDMVRSGYAYALVNQPVYEEHYRAVEILIAYLKGEKYDYNNPIPSPIITIDGLDTLEALAARSLTDLPSE
jgi:ABC-type sugar transport system substrate-binding protein